MVITIPEFFYFCTVLVLLFTMEVVRDYAVASLRMAAPSSPIADKCMRLYHWTGWLISANTFFLLVYLQTRNVTPRLFMAALALSMLWSFHRYFKVRPKRNAHLYLPGRYGADSSLYDLTKWLNLKTKMNLSPVTVSITGKILAIFILSYLYLILW